MSFDFLVETFATERLKTLSLWSQFQDAADRRHLRRKPQSMSKFYGETSGRLAVRQSAFVESREFHGTTIMPALSGIYALLVVR